MSRTRWKNLLRRVLGDTGANALIEFLRIRFDLLGVLDYLMHPERRGGPFNGQQVRMALFESILAKSSPAIIVETGTYLGSTTEYLAATQLPVYSVEYDRRAYGFAKARLWTRRSVHLKRGDSRAALQEWLDGPIHNHRSGPVLFYLDAGFRSTKKPNLPKQ